ncbi:MAG TPA: hypothetical protein ENG79_02855 [Desulfobacteraceae bacterium]|nr:hypothetical protein [Desulfobacteraceae bacterium]
MAGAMLSLRKILFSVFCAVASLLTVVVILGLLQYRFTSQFDTIIYQGEKILFRFTTLHEQMTHSMLAENWSEVDKAADKIESLNSELTRLLENNQVPDEYKLALINQVDLHGIALLARRVATDPNNRRANVLRLNGQLRQLADNLMQFDRVLATRMRTRLVRFQGLAIGALTLIIAGVSLLIILLYQKALMPLILLSQHLQKPNQVEPLSIDPRSCKEIADLTDHVNTMIAAGRLASANYDQSSGRYFFAPRELNKLSNYLNGIINYTQLLIDEVEQNNVDDESLEILKKVQQSGELMGSILQNKQGGRQRDD